MITDFIIYILLLVPNTLLSAFSGFSFDLSIPSSVYDGMYSLFGCLGYIFPVSGLLPILFFSFSLRFAHIAWAIIIRIKSFIPTMGN